ncbi:MAG: CRISPR-associated endonuclease Cas1 [Thermodesulfobacteriota bacterium]
MTVIYISDQGASLVKSGHNLVVEKAGQPITQYHAFKIQQLVLMGQVQVTPNALAFLLQQGIDTVFLSFQGKFRGRLISGLSKNIDLRRAQFRFLEDPARALELAKKCVAGKIENCRVLLRRQNQRSANPEVKLAVSRLRRSLDALSGAADLDSLRGREGGAAAAYFKGFGQALSPEEFRFHKRTRRPPRDPVNALLSLGYTLLANVAETAVQTAGLDPYLGALHAPEYGRPSLVLDLMEEFRPLLVDTIVLGAINRRQIARGDFYLNPEAEIPEGEEEREGLSSEERPVILTHEGIKKFVALFERRLREKTVHPRTEERLDYREICLAQARLMAKCFQGEADYSAFTWR